MVAEMRRMAWAFEWLYSVADPKNCSIERLAKLMRTARACGFVNWFDIPRYIMMSDPEVRAKVREAKKRL